MYQPVVKLFAIITLAALAAASAAAGDDDFPLIGTYTEDQPCKADDSDPSVGRVKITETQIELGVRAMHHSRNQARGQDISDARRMSGAKRQPDAGRYQLQPAGGQDPGFFRSGPDLQGSSVQMPVKMAPVRRVGKGARPTLFSACAKPCARCAHAVRHRNRGARARRARSCETRSIGGARLCPPYKSLQSCGSR